MFRTTSGPLRPPALINTVNRPNGPPKPAELRNRVQHWAKGVETADQETRHIILVIANAVKFATVEKKLDAYKDAISRYRDSTPREAHEHSSRRTAVAAILARMDDKTIADFDAFVGEEWLADLCKWFDEPPPAAQFGSAQAAEMRASEAIAEAQFAEAPAVEKVAPDSEALLSTPMSDLKKVLVDLDKDQLTAAEKLWEELKRSENIEARSQTARDILTVMRNTIRYAKPGDEFQAYKDAVFKYHDENAPLITRLALATFLDRMDPTMLAAFKDFVGEGWSDRLIRWLDCPLPKTEN